MNSNSIIQPCSKDDPMWWKEAIGYEIYPRTFYDTNHDGIGDLRGIIDKLDYIEKLGVNLLWICPFFKSPMDDNGYDVSDYYQVDPCFGCNEDLYELLDKAHQRGIRVLFDFVMNHTSDEHPWFIEAKKDKNSEYHDYYIWADRPNNWSSFFSDSAWNYASEVNQYYLKIFSKKMPDLNWENPNLRKSMFDIARFWLDKGVDGFRMDAIAHLAKDMTLSDSTNELNYQGLAYDTDKFSNLPRLYDYLAEFKKEVLDYYDCLTIGEVGGCATCESALKYTQYGKGSLNMVFNFDTCWENGAYGSDEKSDEEMITNVVNLKKLFKKWYDAYEGKSWMPVYWVNHDHPRVLSQYGSVKYRKESAKMLCTTLLFMYGTPFLYNGEELGMSNVDYTSIEDFKDVSAQNYYQSKKDLLNEEQILRFLRRTSRINARTPLQWSDDKYAGFSDVEPCVKVNGNYVEVNAKQQENDPDSILHFYRQAIILRKGELKQEAVYGSFDLLDAEHPDVFAYIKKKDKTIAVISNFRDTETDFKLSYKLKKIYLKNYPDLILKCRKLHLRPFECLLAEVEA